jgi:lipoprotein-anchoring transpeptidase ErfK/SrfK
MSRSAQFLSFRAALVLVTVLVTIPTKLHAQISTPVLRSQLDATPIPVKPASGANKQPVTSVPEAAGSSAKGVQSAPGTNSLPNTDKPPQAKSAISSTNQQPIAAVVNLVLKLNEKRVYVYKGDKVIAKYPVAIGKKGWETPTGEWQVLEKIKNPAWTSFKTGEVFAPGGENPLGARWIGFWTDGQDVIGFHGTPNIKSVGTAASHGCVRMYNRDVRALYKLVRVGTTVKVVKE